MADVEPLYPETFHMRLSSDASSTSSNGSNSPVLESRMCHKYVSFDVRSLPYFLASYPAFNIYPLPFFNDDGSVQSNSHSYSHYANQSLDHHAGLLQPLSGFRHHGCVTAFLHYCNCVLTLRIRSACSQIPKLRIACSSGLNGQRTMWSFCEQCGAISMVEAD